MTQPPLPDLNRLTSFEALTPARRSNPWLLPFLVLPWLSPFTAGPLSNFWPLLLSAFCAVVLWLFRWHLSARLVTAAWLVAAAASACIGLAQYFGLAPALGGWVSQTQAGEAFANLRQRNQFATLTSIGLVALLGWVATVGKPGVRHASALPHQQHQPIWADARPQIPALAWLLMGLLALGNGVSSSRTGTLQWVVIAGLTAWWAMPGRRWLVAFALQTLVAYGVALLALPWMLEWATGVQSTGLLGRLSDGPACASRRVLWSNVLTLIGQQPWTGWGWGELSYAHFITLYQGPRFCEILDNAHNLPLHLAVELGIPVALALCGAAAWLVWRAQPWGERDPLRQMAWGVLAVIGLHSLVEYPLWYGPFQLATGLAIGLLCSNAGKVQPPLAGAGNKKQPKTRFPQYLRVFVAMFIVVILMAVASSYYRATQIFLPVGQRSPAYQSDTMDKVRDTWLFRDQMRFAELGITQLTPANAAQLYSMAQAVLHFSPEPQVIEKLIESAAMLGRDSEALQYLVRYRAAFPDDHARWAAKVTGPASTESPLPAASR